ncbi:glycosyltransferase family 4 protein [Phenylobacterium sp.]|jgi:glycosyltransferase involved in cell wall biosynthesis|uniref:glycosyltransferase family 4 protein n=1 Tax=Phenylobacterium sp. TaxID=1871053 RepID=UPI00378379BE
MSGADIIARRRAAHEERRQLAADRWARFQVANRRRYGSRDLTVAPPALGRLLARGKWPGRAALIALSGLWNGDLDVALDSLGGEPDGLAAYVQAGSDPKAQPRALFDQGWYLSQAPGLAGGRWAPLAHYLVLGALEGKSPHPLFDPARFRGGAPRLTPLQRYLFGGAAAGADPHPLFDLRWYVGQCEAVAQNGEDPLVHYLRQGWREGLDPHPLFAGAWYLQRTRGAAEAGIAPLLHYVRIGAEQGADPHPLFDTAHWDATPRRPGAGRDPLSRFLASHTRLERNPAPRFDPAHYFAEAGEAARANPLLHYVTEGTFLGLSPAPGFNEAGWFAANPRFAETPRSALELAAREAPRQGMRPVPTQTAPSPVASRFGPAPAPRSTGLPPVTLIGYPFSPTGMGEHLRVTLQALEAAGVDVRLLDVEGAGTRGDPDLAPLADRQVAAPGALNLFCVNADEIERVVGRLGRETVAAGRNVIFPAWELGRYPAPFARAVAGFDGVWAPSAFVRGAIAEATGKAVEVVPLAVEPRLTQSFGRSWFDIPETPFVVLFFFDFASFASRKNPDAVLAAVERLAQMRPGADVHTVIKVRGAPAQAAARSAFDARVAALGERVQVLEGDFSDSEILNLVALCDAFVSLHRAEGFGFGPAQAMALGRAAVATGYSGNVDYMAEGTSLKVDYELIPVARGAYPHGDGQVWAEPSVEHAARLIAGLVDDPGAAAAMGERARRHMAEHFSYAAVGARARAALEALMRG